jgi:DNA-binding XRE family transcriptional regulator
MDLDALHRKLSEDEEYVRAYAELGDTVELAIHCMSVREQRGITQAQLAAEAGVSESAIAQFENLDGGEERVIDAIVQRLEPWLRERGVHTERWSRTPQHREGLTAPTR